MIYVCFVDGNEMKMQFMNVSLSPCLLGTVTVCFLFYFLLFIGVRVLFYLCFHVFFLLLRPFF